MKKTHKKWFDEVMNRNLYLLNRKKTSGPVLTHIHLLLSVNNIITRKLRIIHYRLSQKKPTLLWRQALQ